MNNQSKQLLGFLFVGSQQEAAVEEAAAKATDAADAEEQNSKALEKRKTELVGILSKLGIKDVKGRLEIDSGAFRLNSDAEQHAADSAVLFDLTKIQPLVDANFVAIDGESGHICRHIVIISLSENGESPEIDEMLSVPTEDELMLERKVDLDAQNLLDKLLKSE